MGVFAQVLTLSQFLDKGLVSQLPQGYTTNDSNMMKPSATMDRMVSIAVHVLNVSATVMLLSLVV